MGQRKQAVLTALNAFFIFLTIAGASGILYRIFFSDQIPDNHILINLARIAMIIGFIGIMVIRPALRKMEIRRKETEE